jgi:hypothetical protein
MESAIDVGGRVSDTELWCCDSCGVRRLTTERNLWCSGTSGVRTRLMTLRVCDRCYHLHPHLLVCCVLYLLREGRTMPQLVEWMAKGAEPAFDIQQHVLRQHMPADAEAVEPYEPSKVIVPVGGH